MPAPLSRCKIQVKSSLSHLLISLLVVAGCETGTTGQETARPSYIAGLSGEYLGQEPPGTEFRRFAPGIITPEMYHSVTVSPNGQEIYWAERTGIMVTRSIEGRWTTPAPVSFSGGSGADFLDDAPVVSPDDTRLYFTSRRAVDSNTESGQYRFWYAERTTTGWGPPQVVPEVISSLGGNHWQVSVSSSGTFYFGLFSEADGDRIFYSRYVDGEYESPQPLDEINSLGQVICPFIAPDESYIIFNRVEAGGRYSEGFYISFRDSDGRWLSPEALPQLPEPESVFVSRDGRYIFNKAYWASAQIIEDLRP